MTSTEIGTIFPNNTKKSARGVIVIVVWNVTIATYTDACGYKINNNDERTQFFRKIYLSLYLKWLRKGCERVMCEGLVGDWTNCNILTPVPLSLAELLSRSAGLLNRGSWWPIAFCWVLVLTTASYLRLTDSN